MGRKEEIAETAVLILQEGVDNMDSELILEAYSIVERDSFDWDDYPDHIFEDWDKLTDEANDIINS